METPRVEDNQETRSWKWSLERVIVGGTLDDLTVAIVSVAHAYGGLSDQKIREGLITFGVDGVPTFQSAKSSVIMQLINKNAPFMVDVNCKAHRISLAVQTLFNFGTGSQPISTWWCTSFPKTFTP